MKTNENMTESNVRRYDSDFANYHGQRVGMHEHPEGAFVSYADYKDLLTEITDLKTRITILFTIVNNELIPLLNEELDDLYAHLQEGSFDESDIIERNEIARINSVIRVIDSCRGY